jgi:arylsulfatase A-like enzyme
MKRRVGRIVASLVVGTWVSSLLGAAPPEKAPARPNILLIYTDDHPYKTIGCYPEAPRWAQTPNIDRLASRGIRFHRAYLGSWCMPSRAAMLTGRLPHGVESMRMAGEYPGSTYDPAQTPFWPAVFRRQGYHTAQIGKWHTGTDTGFGRDWDYQIVWNRPAHPENAGHYYDDQVLAFNGQERRVSGYSTDNYTRWAVDYIKGAHRDPNKPWYLWLCYGAVHGPTTPAPRHRGTHAGRTAPVPADIFGPRPDKPGYLDATQAWEPGSDGRPVMKRRTPRKGNFDKDEPGLDLQKWIQQVNECVRAIDEGIGQVLSALDESGQRAQTLVVFTADQGFALGEHGMSIKLAPYDAALASPLIVSQPGTLPEGKVCRRPINSVDLVATFCARAGVTVPWRLHGRDLSPLLRDPDTAAWDAPVLMEHLGHYYGSDTRSVPTGATLTEQAGVPWWVLLRDDRYKYIRTLVAGETEELYDLDADPEELHNLAAQPAHRARLEALRARTIAELRRTEAPFVDGLPPVRSLDR